MKYTVVTYRYKAADIHGVDCLVIEPSRFDLDVKEMAEQKLGFYMDWISVMREGLTEGQGRMRGT